MTEALKVGIDIGSTTIKVILIDTEERILYRFYQRHYSDIKKVLIEGLQGACPYLSQRPFSTVITGSGGMSIAQWLRIPFIQEVVCSSHAIQHFYGPTDVILELGGEDAKITYLTGGIEQRMNGTCAGGTGSFIDQMAILLNTNAKGLDELATSYDNIYPIAARCGVFAKTDIQPLINEGVRKEDISMSIFHAVVVQTISVLACGRPIGGRVAFLGGPLTFSAGLRQRFIDVLEINEEDVIFPQDSHLYTALGAALSATPHEEGDLKLDQLLKLIQDFQGKDHGITKGLDPLFETEEDYNAFKSRHQRHQIDQLHLTDACGPLFLGIDAGSTTTKAALIDHQGTLVYSFYASNQGDPVACVKKLLKEIYTGLSSEAHIASSIVTGYGESLIKAAFLVDQGEIETIAHYKAAKFFCPDVDFILDIGGQDMKCLKIKNDMIESILLNEACSSGCGSFLETFATSIGLTLENFSNKALYAKTPVDLGTRCTVFMNSKVKQAQRDGADVSDIAAGLCYSVIMNTLYKVIKVRNPQDLGQKMVVQGGTFKNDAVLRCFELLTGHQVVRPEISGIMGAFGAALIGKERYQDGDKTTLLPLQHLDQVSLKTKTIRCKRCPNSCLLTINDFGNGQRYISGNRCERGLGVEIEKNPLPNIYEYKLERLFNYEPLPIEHAPMGVIGLPRVLNMYENYPFWFTFFTSLGFRVELSAPSSKELYEQGIASIASETACFPAKLVHGHIVDLLERGIKTIFYPCIPHEEQEDPGANNCYNCPVVTSYSELIKNNIPCLREPGVTFLNPFLPYNHKRKLKKRLSQSLSCFELTKKDINRAVKEATVAQKVYKDDIRKQGEKILRYVEKNQLTAIVLGGRPYHLDPEINHGIPKLITTLGMAVLSEDAICHLGQVPRPLRVHDQWTYHTRLYQAASFVGTKDCLEFVQLNSFGCGLDAITTEQVKELLDSYGKLYTCIKIDEGTNLGSARIRLRSLKALIEERQSFLYRRQPDSYRYEKTVSSKKTQKLHTLLIPQFAPVHFVMTTEIFHHYGYNAVLLTDYDNILEEGLRYTNNDICYPAIVVIGQIIKALKYGGYDPDNTSVVLAQTGGGCRFTNYTASLRKALGEAGFSQVPIIPLNASGLEKENNIKGAPISMVIDSMMTILYGDLLTRLLYATRPYEINKGQSETLFEKWLADLPAIILKSASKRTFKKTVRSIIDSFEAIPISCEKKPRVGLVGELLVKMHPAANNHLIKRLEEEGVEVMVTDLINLFMSSSYNFIYRYHHLSGSYIGKLLGLCLIKWINGYQIIANDLLEESKGFYPVKLIDELAEMGSQIIQNGNQTGEGWMMPAEIMELMELGANNIIIMQPFGCLPGHVTGKGVMKILKERYEDLNIVAVDFDPGASEVNQINRIKLMLANAFKDK